MKRPAPVILTSDKPILIPLLSKSEPFAMALVNALQDKMIETRIVPHNHLGRQDFSYNQPTVAIMKRLSRSIGVNIVFRKGPSGEMMAPFAIFKNEAAYLFFVLKWSHYE